MRRWEDKMEKDLEYYMSLPYTFRWVKDEDVVFIRVVELPGCMTIGDSVDDALFWIKDAMKEWIHTALEDGVDIPEPEAK
jgi:antitoxin HicB